GGGGGRDPTDPQPPAGRAELRPGLDRHPRVLEAGSAEQPRPRLRRGL
ncbi:MAG: hypothetical protein AVDCRST_MAG50-1659, partial [uncultured Acidimicrobiales bacterium]